MAGPPWAESAESPASRLEDSHASRLQSYSSNGAALDVLPWTAAPVNGIGGDGAGCSRKPQLDRRTACFVPHKNQLPAVGPDEQMLMQPAGGPGGHPNPEQGIGHGNGVAVEEPDQQPDRLKGELRVAISPDESEIIVGCVTDDRGPQWLVLDLVDPNLLDPRLRQKGRQRAGPPLRLVLLTLPRRGGKAGLIDPDRFSPAQVVSLRNETTPE